MKLSALVSNKRGSKERKTQTVFFCLYTLFILFVTLLCRHRASVRTYNFHLFWEIKELVAGIKHGKIATVRFIANIVLFVPYVLLFPWNKENKRLRMWIKISSAFLISLSIEFLQYISALGLCEIDDVIANTTGALIGALLLELVYTAGNIHDEKVF